MTGLGLGVWRQALLLPHGGGSDPNLLFSADEEGMHHRIIKTVGITEYWIKLFRAITLNYLGRKPEGTWVDVPVEVENITE